MYASAVRRGASCYTRSDRIAVRHAQTYHPYQSDSGRTSDGAVTTPLGARVEVEAGNETHVRTMNGKSDFLSQDSRVLHVGTGNRTHVDVTVTWPEGPERTFERVRTGQRITVTPDGITRTTALGAQNSTGGTPLGR